MPPRYFNPAFLPWNCNEDDKMAQSKRKYANEEESVKINRCLEAVKEVVFDEFGTGEDAVYYQIVIACHFAARVAYCGLGNPQGEKDFLDTIKLQLDMMHKEDNKDKTAIAG